MAQNTAKTVAPRRPHRPRRPAGTSTVRELMLAKLGPRGFGRLLDQLRKEAS